MQRITDVRIYRSTLNMKKMKRIMRNATHKVPSAQHDNMKRRHTFMKVHLTLLLEQLFQTDLT